MEQTQLRTARKELSSLGLCYLIGTIAIYGSQYLVRELVLRFRPEWLANMNTALIFGMIPMYLIGMPILILLVKRLPATVPQKNRMKPGQFALSYIMCYSLSILCNVVGLVLTFIIGMMKGSVVNNTIVNITSNTNLGIMFVYMVICAPIMEEYVFRKLIVDRTLRYGQGVAVLVSGLMFGLFHGNLNQFVYAFPMGMFMAFLYVKTGKLKITIAIHMIINFMGSIVATLLMEGIALDEYNALVLRGAGQEALTKFIMSHLLGWLCYFGYIFLVLGLVIAGFVLFIVFRKRFKVAPGEVVIPKGKRFQTVFVNIGMGLFSLFWVVMIILQLFE